MSTKKYQDLIAIVPLFVLGVCLFFYKLDTIPNGFYIDEALPGYNAFSILKTGRDEYGKLLPMFLRFYGSYNPPLFTYLTIPSVALFGLNVFAVRFFSSLAGLLTVIPFWFLLRSSGLLKNKLSVWVATALMIISPWLILHSRVGYEVSLAFMLFTFGILFAWRGLKDPNKLPFGFLILSLSTYAAYAERFLVPLFLVAYLIAFRKRLFKRSVQKYLRRSVIIALVTQIPHFFLLTTPAFLPKGNEIAESAITSQAQKIILFPYKLSLTLAYFREFLSQYITYFSPRSLFFLPDPDLQRSIPELSTLYFWMTIPYLIGFYVLWKKRKHDFSKLIIVLALVSPIPAALTKDPFATHRAIPHLLPIMLIVSLGINNLLQRQPKLVWRIATVGAITFSLILLWRSYFVLLPNERAIHWGYGSEQLAAETTKYPETLFIIDQSRKQPEYINLLFFLKYPPDKYQKEMGKWLVEDYYYDLEFDQNISFGNIELRGVVWEEDIYKDQILVGDSLAISKDQAEEHFLKKLFEIKSPIGEVVWIGYETNPKTKCASDPENPSCININKK